MIHFRSEDKSKALDVIKLVLSTFIMPHAKPEIKSQIIQHVAAMDAEAGMDVQARLMADKQNTRLVLDISFPKASQ